MMRIRDWSIPLLAAVGAMMLATGTADAESHSITQAATADEDTSAPSAPVQTEDLCGPAQPGFMRCFAKRVISPVAARPVSPDAPFAPSGYGPPDLRSAYNLPSSGGNGRIIAIVDAMDAPNAEADLGTYRSHYGLSACTTANGCFKKVNQNGQASPLPTADSGWEGEIMLDLDMASAVCPDCKIVLVEANSASTDDLGAAVNTAVMLGASAVSNSYGGMEDNTVNAADAYYTHPGTLIVAASGDSGFAAGASYPASSPHVLGVGGTNLAKSSTSRGWTEKAWSSGGSGCSAFFSKPSFQKDPTCTKRMVADVAAVADPQTGLAVYDGGWQVVGGTSAASPIVASIFTLFNLTSVDLSFPYTNTTAFYDVTSGSNGSCSTPYYCKAAAGYDGPTGIGTPNGTVLATLMGNSPPDAGAPDAAPTPDASAPPDAGSPDASAAHDSGSTQKDSGSSGEVDSGSSGGFDSGSSTGPGGDSGTNPGDDAGSSSSGDDFTSSSPSGCGCAVPGQSSPFGNGARIGFGIAAIALVFARRKKNRA